MPSSLRYLLHHRSRSRNRNHICNLCSFVVLKRRRGKNTIKDAFTPMPPLEIKVDGGKRRYYEELKSWGKFNHFQLTETPFLGPLKEISMPLCSQETLMGGRSVKDTTQLRLSMLPMSTYMSGSPMMCVSGSAKRNIVATSFTIMEVFWQLVPSRENSLIPSGTSHISSSRPWAPRAVSMV